MPFIQQGAFSFLHANQADNLSAIYTADQIKNKFDSQALELKTTLNNLIIGLGSTTVANSGAENVGIEAISGVTGANVQDALQNLKTQVDTKVSLTGNKTISGTITMVGDIVGTGYTVDFSSIRQDGVRLTDMFLPFTGGTITGSLVSNGTIQQDKSTTNATIIARSSSDDSQIRLITTATDTYVQSGNYSWTTPKNLRLTGNSNTALPTLTINATSTNLQGAMSLTGAITAVTSITASGTVTAPTVTVTGTITGATVNATGNLQENGTNLTSKYAQLGANTFTASQTLSSGGITISEGTISAGSATNDGRIRTAQTATLNYIQSGNNAGSAPKNLTISGYGATTMSEVNIVTNTLKINGQPLQSGSVTITPVANTPTKATVTFSPAFTVVPHVVCTAESAVPGTQVTGFAVANITTTGCDIYVTRTNTNSTTVHWIAMA